MAPPGKSRSRGGRGTPEPLPSVPSPRSQVRTPRSHASSRGESTQPPWKAAAPVENGRAPRSGSSPRTLRKRQAPAPLQEDREDQSALSREPLASLLDVLIGVDSPQRRLYVDSLVRAAADRGSRVGKHEIIAHLCARADSPRPPSGRRDGTRDRPASDAGMLQSQITYVIRLLRLGLTMQMMYALLYWLHQWVGFWDATPDLDEWVMPINVAFWIAVPLFLNYVVWTMYLSGGGIHIVLAYIVLVMAMILLIFWATWMDPDNGTWWTVWYM